MANRLTGSIGNDTVVIIGPGDHFDLLLPDGTILNVEQTADDFTICRQNGIVAYTKPTSDFAKSEIENEHARLIAAAPEMYDLITELAHVSCECADIQGACNPCRSRALLSRIVT